MASSHVKYVPTAVTLQYLDGATWTTRAGSDGPGEKRVSNHAPLWNVPVADGGSVAAPPRSRSGEKEGAPMVVTRRAAVSCNSGSPINSDEMSEII